MDRSNEMIEFVNNDLSSSYSQNFEEDHQGGRRPPTGDPDSELFDSPK